MQLSKLANLVGHHSALLDKSQSDLKIVNKHLETSQKYTIIINDTKGLFENLLEISRKEVKDKIESVVTLALREILSNDNIKIKIDFQIKRNQPEAVIYVDNDGVVDEIPNAFGGGIEDIVSTILKILFAHILGIKGPYWIDEPGKWIDSYSSVKFAQFLKHLSKKFNKQMFINTHRTEIVEVADNLIKIYQEDGISYVNTN